MFWQGILVGIAMTFGISVVACAAFGIYAWSSDPERLVEHTYPNIRVGDLEDAA